MFIDYVALLNDTIKVDSGTSISDWCAIVALLFSIGTLIWQGILRRQDKQEQLERIQKEDKIRQWNALYPHRLDFYTDFFKTYNQFVNYTETSFEVRLPNRAGFSQERVFNTKELFGFVQKFYNFCEESEVLFNKDISDLVCNVYDVIQDLGYQPLPNISETLQDLSIEISSFEKEREYTAIKEKLLSIQSQLIDLKWDIDLRKKFVTILKLEGNKYE